MTTFLQHIATDLKSRFGADFSNVTIVFPNKRASLFLNEALISISEGPVWAPRYKTINDLFASISNSIVADRIEVISTLYYIYRELLPEETETMDQFWGWGEIMLADFDDVDKHLVDAEKLFRNAEELRTLDDISFLDDEQEQALQQFFNNFSKEGYTRIQQRFISLWNVMYKIYTRIQEEMPKGTYPWAGAQLRHVVEDTQLLSQIDENTTFVFVGFNMLNEVEKKLMKYLDKRHQALFYWDYDEMYYRNKSFEAGEFMRENLMLFPNSLTENLSKQEQLEIYDQIQHKGELTFISTSTDSIQSRYIPTWLSRFLGDKEEESALILCDENQLMPVLHSVPVEGNEDGFKSPREINVTMGYPLRNTPVFSFVSLLLRLQTEGFDYRRKRFRRSFENAVENHPLSHTIDRDLWCRHVEAANLEELITYLDEAIIKIPVKAESEEDMDILHAESIFLTHKTLQKFLDLVTNKKRPLDLQPITARRLLKRVLGTESIPFHGEPATGLQVMGVLETRCLDFKNILMLSVGEGFFPRTVADTSLIPNTLRVGFKLTTQRHRIAVYAYYFYRLMQRAENITFVYNENSSGITKHEMSRFLRQIQAETDIPIRNIKLQANQKVEDSYMDDIVKTPEIMAQMHQLFDTNINPKAGSLTPSAINHYLNCPMSFYLSDICRLRPTEEGDETIDPATMGDIFHEAAHQVYHDLMKRGNGVITREMLSQLTMDKARLLQPYIDHAFETVVKTTDYRGENILIRNVIEKYLLNLLRYDMNIAPIKIVLLEEYRSTRLTVDMPDGTMINIKTGGQIDRMDIILDKDGNPLRRIVDYKTGSHSDDVNEMDKIFKRDVTHAGYYLQTFLYSLATIRQDKIKTPIKPILFYVNRAGAKDYDPTLYIGTKTAKEFIENFHDILPEYEAGLKDVIREIFTPGTTFNKASGTAACTYCNFRNICNK